jgi:hypothetical protein
MGTGISADGADDGVVSPELVLVDPSLRQLLASRPPPTPTVAPPVAPPDREPVAAAEPAVAKQSEAAGPPLRVAEPVAPAPPPPIVPAVLPKRRRWWPIVVAALAGAGLAAAGTIVLLPRGTAKPEVERVVDPSTGQIGQPAASTPTTHPTTAAAVTTAPTPPPRSTTGREPKSASHPATRPATTAGATRTTPRTTQHRQQAKPKPKTSTTSKAPTKSNPRPPATTTHQKLAWAPAAGATAYDMELLRNATPVFHTRTSQSSVVIVVRKGAEGPAGSLRAGEYEWIVWPILHGHRAAQAIVRSRLTLAG